MSPKNRIFLGVAMTLLTVATAFPQYERGSRDDDFREYRPSDGDVARSGYSYVRETIGGVTVESRFNGRVTARRNMPITAGDEILVSEAGRAEIGLADGNLLFVGGGTRARFSSLYAQQGEDDDFSAIDLRDGSVILATTGADEGAIPRIDTEDATVYLSPGSRVRVNADPRRGTVVVVRAGSVEVRTRTDTYTVEEGRYLMVEGDETPDIARGVFSRDRFDLWASERLDDVYSDRTRSASVEYVDDEYASEVVALDDYGDWEYSSSYSTNVWRPRVSVGWTPYSHGSWYYTPIGLTWWSYDPWGWYPHHYGSWYFDAGFHNWAWVPGYAYSPAWVYWAYTPRYVGWCPVGYYSYYSPWFDSYHRRWGWSPGHRRSAGLMFAISGKFKTRDVDFRGWNFVGAGGFGSGHERVNVVPGSRLRASLGEEIAISGKPIVVSARGGSLVNALQEHVRQAPARIERTNGRDARDLAPVLGRQRTLSTATLDALKDRTVLAGRGRLAGPGADQLATRGAIVERGRSIPELLRSQGPEKGASKGSLFERGRKDPAVSSGPAAAIEGRETRPGRSGDVTRGDVWRGRSSSLEKGEKGPDRAEAPRQAPEREGGFEKGNGAPRAAEAPAEWRGRGRDSGRSEAPAPSVEREGRRAKPEAVDRGRPEVVDERRAPKAPAESRENWRQRPAKAPKAPAESRSFRSSPELPGDRQKPARSLAREESWRGGPRRETAAEAPAARQERRRSEAPAKRVIEGAVPGRKWQDTGVAPRRSRESSAPADWRQRSEARRFERAPEAAAPRVYKSEPRFDRAPEAARPAPRELRSQPREYRAPRSESRPQPREYRAPRSESRPQPREYREAPRGERAPQYSAPPAPRSQSRPAPAPQPSGGGFGKGQSKGRKG